MSYRLFFCSIITLFIGILGLNTGVYWDNITFVSQMGNALFENGILKWWSIPVEHDPGHPPLMATIMAVTWKLFGKSLLVSHLILWPFIFGVIWQLYNLCSFFLSDIKQRYLAIILIVLDTTFLSHIALIDIEVPQLFFTLFLINSIIKHQRIFKLISLTLLSMLSLRGMMLCFGLFIFDIILYLYHNKPWKDFFRHDFPIYVIAAIPSVVFVTWRLLDKGWIISNPMHIWGESTSFNSLYDFIKNAWWNFVVIGHRYLDFGRSIPIIFLIYTLIKKKECLKKLEVKCLLLIAVTSISIVFGTSLCLRNNIDHRYFIISFIALELLAFILINQYKNRIILYALLAFSLLSGSFYVYPDRVAAQWDSTMAHYSYWNLRRQALIYMDENNIPINQTASFFPNISIDEVELNGDKRLFQHYNTQNEYVLYSNVMVLYDADYYSVLERYDLVKRFENMGIRVEIRKRKQ